MSDIPHDQYLEFIDDDIYTKIIEFHELSNYTIHESTSEITRLHFLTEDIVSRLTGNQLEVTPCSRRIKANITPLEESHPLMRKESISYFSKNEISFDSILGLLRPLITRKTDSTKRGYPSGGALYPIEIFLCRLENNISDWPSDEDILHLLPKDRCLEELHTQHGQNHLKRSILPKQLDIGEPSIAIVLAAYLPKTVFKYRYRGYRLATMEAGSIYQTIDLHAKHYGLGTRIWSGFCDHMITSSIGLSPTLYLPLCTVLIGKAI
jgi:SagB-type dehydrogenase family enzyme